MSENENNVVFEGPVDVSEIRFSTAGDGHTMRITKDGFYLDEYLIEPSGKRAHELFEFMLEWASEVSDKRRIRVAVERLRKLTPESFLEKYRVGDPLENAVFCLEEWLQERRELLKEIEVLSKRLIETEAELDSANSMLELKES